MSNSKIETMNNKYIMPSFTDFLEETDIEKIRYMIGGYVHTTHNHIQTNTLYPITSHTNTLLQLCDDFLASINKIDAIIPKELTGIDIHNNTLQYRPLEFDDIVDRQYKKTVFVKKKIAPLRTMLLHAYQAALDGLHWEMIGLHASVLDEGYVFTQAQPNKTIYTYRFSIKKLFTIEKTYKIVLRLCDVWNYSPYTNTFHTKKQEYAKQTPLLAGMPPCILVSWDKQLPHKSTVIPLIQENLPGFLHSHAV